MSEKSIQIHSLIISGKNTYDDWHLIPTERPSVAFPEVKESYVEIPGANGKLDYTEVLAGAVTYNNSSGSWEFIVENGHQPWYLLYDQLLNYLHGKEHTIILEDEPDYQYKGRLKLNPWKSDKHYSKITIDYDLQPFKSMVSGDISDWKWDDLTFTSDIYKIMYGIFDVTEPQKRNVYSPNTEETELSMTLTAPMTIKYYGVTFEIQAGLTEHTGIMLQPGDNILEFVSGVGRVKLNYDKGVSLV